MVLNAILIFLIVYSLSVYLCNTLDNVTQVEDKSLINYIPVINTLLIILCFSIAILWHIADLIRYGRKKKK